MHANQKLCAASLTGNGLKWIAIAAMTLDHLAWTLWPGYDTRVWVLLLHVVGRLTAPIMWFLIAEGYHYTRDRKKYALRLFLFAVLSHFAYCFFNGNSFLPFADGAVLNQTSVMWALFLSVAAMLLFDVPQEKLPQPAKLALFLVLCAAALPADWSCIAVLAVCCIASARGNFRKQMVYMMLCVVCYSVVYCLFLDLVYGLLQFCVVLSVPVLALYNGKRGKGKGSKWFFYWYYPLHLVFFGLVRLWLDKA